MNELWRYIEAFSSLHTAKVKGHKAPLGRYVIGSWNKITEGELKGSYRGFVNSLSMTFAASMKGGLKTRIGNVISRRTIMGKFEEVK